MVLNRDVKKSTYSMRNGFH